MGLKNDTFLQKAFVEHYTNTGNMSKTCKELDIGRDTVYRLMKSSPDFAEQIEGARAEYLSRMAASFQEYAPEALEALVSVIRDENAPSTAKVQAAGRIIDYSKEWGEAVDMEQRITSLQRDIAEAEREVC